MKSFLESDPGIKICKCGHKFAVETGAVDYGYKDEYGRAISDEAAIHMAENRINCPECHHIFCGSCNAAPYHLGKTCQEHKEYRES